MSTASTGGPFVRAALTQTINAYDAMPASVGRLADLETSLDAVRDANVRHHVDLMAEAARQNVRVICFGELFTGPYFALTHHPMWLALAESAVDGPTVRALCEAARTHALVVVAPIYELDTSSGRRFNTAVVIDEQGRVVGKFRKAHIPHGSNEKGSFLEGFYYERSDGENGSWPANVSSDPFYPVFETSVGRLGVAICYDRHFAGVMWTLARERAQIVFSPAVTFGAKSERMWQMEFGVDAARHNLFIGGSNRLGQEAPWNQPFFGQSHFVGPNGALPNLSTHPNLIISDLDLGVLDAADPAGWNLQRDLRHDVVTRRESRIH